MTATDDIDATIEMAAEEALGTIREMMQRPVRLAPFAIVVGTEGIVTMPILDLESRVPAIRFAIAKVQGLGFVMFYDGVLAPDRHAPTSREALFRVQMTHAGHGRAIAYPYHRTGGIVTFGTPEDNPDSLAWLYRATFADEKVN